MRGGGGEARLGVIILLDLLVPRLDGATGAAIAAPGDVLANMAPLLVMADPAALRPFLRLRRQLVRPGDRRHAMLRAIAIVHVEQGIALGGSDALGGSGPRHQETDGREQPGDACSS